jgi:hypothetical protein
MGDIHCRVCKEPWDYWGARHGDMAAWEYDLFRKGAGCPHCQGEAESDHTESHLASVVLTSGCDDPDSFETLHGADRPKWVEPEPKKLWTCACCNVSVVISNEAGYDGDKQSDDDIWLQWHGGEKVHYSYGCGPYTYGHVARDDAETEAPFKIGGKPYCPGCATACAECGEHLFSREQPGDCYDVGYSFPHPGNPFWGSVCLDCYEKETTCEDCGEYCHNTSCACED